MKETKNIIIQGYCAKDFTERKIFSIDSIGEVHIRLVIEEKSNVQFSFNRKLFYEEMRCIE
jgi:hypothetical protein